MEVVIILRKSPFKPGNIESDPDAYALRKKEILLGATNLYNNTNILISGPRGIGKSSLATQLQNLFKPDTRLLSRCGSDSAFSSYQNVFYAIDGDSNLRTICIDILSRLEFECKRQKKLKPKNLDIEIDLKFIKAKLGSEIETSNPSSIISQFILGLSETYNYLHSYFVQGICIFIDELDQLHDAINFGHFIKLVHEYKQQDSLDNIIFILAGQRGIYSRLVDEDKSVERLLTHIPLSILAYEESQHILDHASSNCEIPFLIEENAKDAILKISSGYPYRIQMLGHAAFQCMTDYTKMTLVDVSRGLENVLRTDKHEKYIKLLKDMDLNGRKVMNTCSEYISDTMPAHIDFKYLRRTLKDEFNDWQHIYEELESLRNLGILIVDNTSETIQFADELFRLFLWTRRSLIATGEEISIEEYTKDEIETCISQIESSKIEKDWDIDEFEDVMQF